MFIIHVESARGGWAYGATSRKVAPENSNSQRMPQPLRECLNERIQMWLQIQRSGSKILGKWLQNQKSGSKGRAYIPRVPALSTCMFT